MFLCLRVELKAVKDIWYRNTSILIDMYVNSSELRSQLSSSRKVFAVRSLGS